MSDDPNDIAKALGEIFDTRDERLAAEQRQAQIVEEKQRTFTEDAVAVFESVVRPAFEEIAEIANKRGVTSKISTAPKNNEAAITIDLAAAGKSYQGMIQPSLSVIVDRHASKVRFHRSTMSQRGGGSSGPAGTCTLEELTKEKVQQTLLAIIKESFS